VIEFGLTSVNTVPRRVERQLVLTKRCKYIQGEREMRNVVTRGGEWSEEEQTAQLLLLAAFLVLITSVLPVCCNINPGKRVRVQDRDDGVKGHGVHEKAARTMVLVEVIT
jgi:hypothetical protein